MKDPKIVRGYRNGSLIGIVGGLIGLVMTFFVFQNGERCLTVSCIDSNRNTSGFFLALSAFLILYGIWLSYRYDRNKHILVNPTASRQPEIASRQPETTSGALERELKKLSEMKESGVISEEEYTRLRNKIINT